MANFQHIIPAAAMAADSMMAHDSWRRHANPWSVWTRLATVPFIAAAIYSRVWLGWWSLLAFLAVAIWLWLNVRIFAPVTKADRWESRAIFGEWLWINRARLDLPPNLLHAAFAPLAASFVAAAVGAFGVIWLEPWPTLVGSIGVIAGQFWFLSALAALFDAAGDDVGSDTPWQPLKPSPAPVPDRR